MSAHFTGRPPLPRATEVFWERVSVALAAQGESLASWAREAGVSASTLHWQRANKKMPPKEYLFALRELTGCTPEFLFNPNPVDLSK